MGTPPTAVFVGKLTVFIAAWDGGYVWLVLLAAANTVLSLFYYLRWIAPTFRSGPPPAADDRRPHATVAAVVAGGCVLGLGLLAGPVLSVVHGPLAP